MMWSVSRASWRRRRTDAVRGSATGERRSRKHRRNTARVGWAHGRPVRGIRADADPARLRGRLRRDVRPRQRGAPAVPADPSGSRPDEHRRAARSHRGARRQLPRAGRDLRLRGRGAALPARRGASRHRPRRVGRRRARHRPARAGPGALPLRHLRAAEGNRRWGHPRRHHLLLLALPPRRGGHPERERRAHPGLRHRPHPRRARHVARARGQRAGAERRELRHLESPRYGADPARAVRLDARAPRGRLPEPTAARPARLGAERGGRAHGRRPHAGRLQLGLLRAHAPRAPHGSRARRGPRLVLLGRARLHAHDVGPAARRRHLPPRRRRVPRPADIPRRFDARHARPHARGAPGQRDDRERGRQRRRRRQARLHLHARSGAVLPR